MTTSTTTATLWNSKNRDQHGLLFVCQNHPPPPPPPPPHDAVTTTTTTTTTDSTVAAAVKECCQTIVVLLSQLCDNGETHWCIITTQNDNHHNNNHNNNTIETSFFICESRMAQVPSNVVVVINDEMNTSFQWFTLWLSSNSSSSLTTTTSSSSLSKQQQQQGDTSSSSIGENNIVAPHYPWKQNVNGHWMLEKKYISSPFLTTSTTTATVKPQTTEEEEEAADTVLASSSLYSTLSDDGGGMHRLFHHSLTLACPNKKKDNVRYQVNATVLMFVTEHVYIDVDDFILKHDHFHDDQNDDFLTLELVLLSSSSSETTTTRKRIIDIEQPSFVSPQHVVAIQLQHHQALCHTNTNNNHHHQDGEIHIDFSTKWHIRYPQVTYNGHFQTTLPAPLLLHGSMIEKMTTATTTRPDSTTTTTTTITTTAWQEPILIYIATGYNVDYYWVGMTTILWSLVGAWYLLKNISHVARWKDELKVTTT